MFTLHPQLEKDTFLIHDLPLCKVLLMNNKFFPWLILVPKHTGCRDLFDVPAAQQPQLFLEMQHCHEVLKRLTNAEKMNVGALGNMVPQLHIHLIARTAADAAWPKPVWGGPAEPYGKDEAEAFINQLRPLLAPDQIDVA